MVIRGSRSEIYTDNENLSNLLAYISSVEKESDHPLAKAVVDYIGKSKVYPVENTNVVKGGGIVAGVDGHRVAVGNLALMKQEKVNISEKAYDDIKKLEKKGTL